MLKNSLIFLLTLFLVACTSVRQTQELQRGRLSFEGGEYRDAFRQLLPLASEGDREAEYAVGYMYYYGYGVSQDKETGAFWIKKSAAQGYEPAMKAVVAIKK